MRDYIIKFLAWVAVKLLVKIKVSDTFDGDGKLFAVVDVDTRRFDRFVIRVRQCMGATP